MKKLKTNLVAMTSMYLEASPKLIIAVSLLYAGKSPKLTEVEKQLDEWERTGKYNLQVEDFCLDVLAKRITLDSILEKKGFK